MIKKYLLTSLFSILSCTSIFGQSAKYALTDGYYRLKNDKLTSQYYLKIEEDSICLYHDKNSSAPSKTLALPNETYVFSQNSFDLDIISIPFKIRPQLNGFPNQLVTNFNGGVFIGFRKDTYRVSTATLPYRNPYLKIKHFGYSIGFFGGFGASTINSYVMKNQLDVDYEGLIFNKGLAAIFAIKNINFGAGVGFDNLLDKNHSDWIYQNKPWIGLVVALNLN